MTPEELILKAMRLSCDGSAIELTKQELLDFKLSEYALMYTDFSFEGKISICGHPLLITEMCPRCKNQTVLHIAGNGIFRLCEVCIKILRNQ